MEKTKAQLQETAKELNKRFGLNPPIDINIDQIHLELGICKRLFGLMSPVAGENLPNILLNLMANGHAHTPDEN